MDYRKKSKEILMERVGVLSEKELDEVLTFVEFLKIREKPWFIDYVNERTSEALQAKEGEERFVTIEELQRELS
ncbi:MAG: hypothetical protein MUP21_10360 [Dehalococcoidia bacterium]|nr:hypothetical protein [Dehalococcoidia bacterium]